MDISRRERTPEEQQRKFRQLQLLFDLAGAVSHAKEPREIYRAAAQGLVDVLAADRAAVLFFDTDDVLRFKEWVGLSEEYRAAVEGHTPWRQGVGDAQPIAVADVMQDAALSVYREAFTKEGIRAVAFIPVVGKSGLIGKFMLYCNAPHEFQAEELQVAQAIATDVAFATERQQAEIALRESEQRLALAQSAANLGVWDCDLRTNVTTFFGEYAKLHGMAPDHPPLAHGEWLRGVHQADRERVVRLLKESIERTHIWDAEFRYLWPDGSVHWLHGKGKVFLDDSGLPVRMTGASFDISERKQAEAALHESEERFRTMADTAPVMIWCSGRDKRCTFFNKIWLEFTGRTIEQELCDGWAESVHPEDVNRRLDAYSSSFHARRNFQVEYRLRRKDGAYRWVLDNGVPRFEPDGVFAGYIGSCIDITDLERIYEEHLAKQQLETVGALTGGIAHDFNNLLGGVLAHSEVALSELANGSPPTQELQRIRSAAIRGSEIVRQLMIYAGQEDEALELVSISGVVEDMLDLLKVSVSKHVRLETDLRNVPTLRGNPSQIRQVVMNLITNASEAIGDRDGIIRVTTRQVTVGRDSTQATFKSQPEGEYIQLEISDTGRGMTPEVQSRIFDPLFTTKVAGIHGLGLVVVQRIVLAFHGTIQLSSAPGKGTAFQILLPCEEQTVHATQSKISHAREEALGSRGDTILVVEDEDPLRQAVSKMLRKRGFSVIEASDGFAASDLIRAQNDHIDLLLLDITLPGASSREVYEEAKRLRSGMPVIITSAKSEETAAASLGWRVERFLRKPFRLDDLVHMIRTTLSS